MYRAQAGTYSKIKKRVATSDVFVAHAKQDFVTVAVMLLHLRITISGKLVIRQNVIHLVTYTAHSFFAYISPLRKSIAKKARSGETGLLCPLPYDFLYEFSWQRLFGRKVNGRAGGSVALEL